MRLRAALPVKFVRRLLLAFVVVTVATTPVWAAKKKKKKAADNEPVPVAVGLKPEVVKKAKPLRKEGPNVLFIMADDLNDYVGWMGGHPQAKTPNMDRLAKMGVSFTNAHCAYALCNPSRTSILTGMWPWKSGVGNNNDDWRRAVTVQGKSTLPEYFWENGYLTEAGGKIFHANHGGPESKLTGWHGGRRGFEQDVAWDERFPEKGVQIPVLPTPIGQNYNGLDIWHWDWGTIPQKDEDTDDGKVVAWAEKRLKDKTKEPFFLAVGLYRPHSPWYAPQKYFDMFPLEGIQLPKVKDGDLGDVPEAAKSYLKAGYHEQVKDKNLWKQAVRAYLANVAFCDAMLGRVLDALEQGPNAKDTVIVFMSDHGWYLGEKERWHKGGLWEEATRVPLCIVAPGVTTAGGQCAQPVSLVDVYPTLCELAKLSKPAHVDGESLVPQLKDPAAKRERPALTAMGEGKQAGYAVRTDRWRYIKYPTGAEELYDHQKDPNEWDNVAGAADNAAVKTELAKALPTEWVSSSRAADKIQVDASPDGSVTYWLEPGDDVDGDTAPNITEHGLSFETVFEYNPDVDANSSLITQGSGKLGYALHLMDGKPAFTVNYDGLHTTLKADEALKPGRVILRALLGLDGTLAIAATGLQHEARGFTPMEGGFPRKPQQGLMAGKAFGALPAELFPASTPFDGVIHKLTLQILPGTTIESRAAKAVPVD